MTDTNQAFANYLLHEAYKARKLANIFFDVDEDDNHWMIYNEKARALYNAWSKYTDIEFTIGFAELDNLTDEDFENIEIMS